MNFSMLYGSSHASLTNKSPLVTYVDLAASPCHIFLLQRVCIIGSQSISKPIPIPKHHQFCILLLPASGLRKLGKSLIPLYEAIRISWAFLVQVTQKPCKGLRKGK